jgi:DNA-binding MarR family transcriptional regulator
MATKDARDTVDEIVEAWAREHPGLDFSPLKILSRVSRLAKQLEKTRRASFATAGLEPWEFDVLAALRRAGAPHELSPKALLEQTYVSSGTMTNRIDGMVRGGLVQRRTDPNDGRGVLVSMTDEGRDRVDRAISDLVAAETELLAGLSRSEQDRLAALLRRLSLDMA